MAEAIIRILPNDIPLPTFASEPDGAISLDWLQSRIIYLRLALGLAISFHLHGWMETIRVMR